MNVSVTPATADKIKAGKSGLLMVSDNYDAFAARVLAARSAARTLDLMYYLWHDDLTGRLLLQEVVRAAQRGVRVRMLLDDVNPRKSDAAYLALSSHPNIELKLFNPSGIRARGVMRGAEVLLRIFALTRRMHNKAWIADDNIAIVGGRNIGDAYFDAGETNFRDLDMLLLGPAVQQTTQIFQTFWACQDAKPIGELGATAPGSYPPYFEGSEEETESTLLSGIGDKGSIAEFIAASSDIHWVERARVISDPPEKVRGWRPRGWLMKELLPIIRSARKGVEIVSPYFIPGKKGSKILGDLVDDGVQVAVLTNSLAATDVAAAHGAYANYRKRLLRKGVQLFELQPFRRQPKISVFGSKGASLHTKAFSVDNRIGFVGSFNFDPRSVSLNSEMGVLFEDEKLVAELRHRFKSEIAPEASYRLELKNDVLRWHGSDEGRPQTYTREPEAAWSRRILATLVRYLPIESQL
ncbi:MULTISPECIES: phospholipase D family protein [unclassified Mesorhizobium]|uniref:phospholipase D family protein n=1 Tax=unclassified Mesorhizobium TaxID=325217 RepID=UPI000BAEBE3C|nr:MULTISPECIES: phospholipase D family protein [unclassified Mesorhizobium]PBB24031.1 phospholipase D family protein [Mesorhizobium sp. WSM4304]PBB72808.1 phospholipase D family protein [Mesorhizobium sp. WSM4308]